MALRAANVKLPSLESVRAEAANELQNRVRSHDELMNEVRKLHIVEIPKKYHYETLFDSLEDLVVSSKILQCRFWQKSAQMVTVSRVELSVGMSARDLQAFLMNHIAETAEANVWILVKPFVDRYVESTCDDGDTPTKKRASGGSSDRGATAKKPRNTSAGKKKKPEEVESEPSDESRDISPSQNCYLCNRMLAEDRWIDGVHKKGCIYGVGNPPCLGCAREDRFGEVVNCHNCAKTSAPEAFLSQFKRD